MKRRIAPSLALLEAQPIAICSPVRTPIGKFGGSLAPLSAPDLGVAAAVASLERAGLSPQAIDQTIFGHGRQAGAGPNPARQISHRAGVPDDRPAWTINQACGSGLQAILAGARSILLGEAEIVLAGGTESMSNTPHLLPRARWGQRLGHDQIVDGMYRDGFDDPLSGMVMGATAEELAEQEAVDREASDAWAVMSQQRYEISREDGRWDDEIVPVEVPGRKGSTWLERDEHPRDGVDLESLTRLKPVFRDGGRVTAGNASGITDGAAAMIVASADAVEHEDLEVVAWLRDWVVVGVEPRIMGIGPVPATEALLERQGIEFPEIDQVELNEAFACQVLACLHHLPFDPEIVNPDGGAIAIGHPIGATGARIAVTLLHGLSLTEGRYGIATLCVSGGQGMAALFERNAG